MYQAACNHLPSLSHRDSQQQLKAAKRPHHHQQSSQSGISLAPIRLEWDPHPLALTLCQQSFSNNRVKRKQYAKQLPQSIICKRSKLNRNSSNGGTKRADVYRDSWILNLTSLPLEKLEVATRLPAHVVNVGVEAIRLLATHPVPRSNDVSLLPALGIQPRKLIRPRRLLHKHERLMGTVLEVLLGIRTIAAVDTTHHSAGEKIVVKDHTLRTIYIPHHPSKTTGAQGSIAHLGDCCISLSFEDFSNDVHSYGLVILHSCGDDRAIFVDFLLRQSVYSTIRTRSYYSLYFHQSLPFNHNRSLELFCTKMVFFYNSGHCLRPISCTIDSFQFISVRLILLFCLIQTPIMNLYACLRSGLPPRIPNETKCKQTYVSTAVDFVAYVRTSHRTVAGCIGREKRD